MAPQGSAPGRFSPSRKAPRCRSEAVSRPPIVARQTAPKRYAKNLMQQEVVEAEGHLIDSHLMEQIFDTVVEHRGRFEVEQFRIGRTNAEPSYLRLKVETPESADMHQLLTHLLRLGCS